MDALPGGWSCDSGVSPVQAWPVCGWRANHGDQACERKHARACRGAACPSRWKDSCESAHSCADAHAGGDHGHTWAAWAHGGSRGGNGGGECTREPGASPARSSLHTAATPRRWEYPPGYSHTPGAHRHSRKWGSHRHHNWRQSRPPRCCSHPWKGKLSCNHRGTPHRRWRGAPPRRQEPACRLSTICVS